MAPLTSSEHTACRSFSVPSFRGRGRAPGSPGRETEAPRRAATAALLGADPDIAEALSDCTTLSPLAELKSLGLVEEGVVADVESVFIPAEVREALRAAGPAARTP